MAFEQDAPSTGNNELERGKEAGGGGVADDLNVIDIAT